MKVEVRKSDIHGKGVFATESIPHGAVVLEIDDSRIVDEEHPVRFDLGEDGDHCDWLPDGTTVLMAEPERYINHSCAPSVFVYSVGRRRFVLAARDIEAGEEILYDYAINAAEGDILACRCGAANCRGRHRCTFFALPERRQLQYIPFLDPWFAQVYKDRVLDLLMRHATQDFPADAERRTAEG
jgi:hypothetical protein